MRVLFLLTQCLDDPSGLGRYFPLARQMARLGYEVEIAALHPAWASLKSRHFELDNVRVSYVAQMHVFQTPGDINRRSYFNTPQLFQVAIAATAALARVAFDRQVDVIHIAKAQPMNGLAGWLGTRLGRRRLYLDCDDDEAASNYFTSEWQRGLVRWWENRLPQAARGVTVNTGALQERCLRQGVSASRITLVPNGFDPDRFYPAEPSEIDAVRQRWQLEDAPVVLYLGSLNLSNHPVTLLLDAFVQVLRHVPRAKLLIVGGGKDYGNLTEAIGARGLARSVVLAGRVDPAEVRSIYAASRVSVDPVLNDATARARSPLKIAESLAMRVPVVTGNIGDRAAMVGNGLAGVLVEPGNPEALAQGILSALLDTERYGRMVEQASCVSQSYRWDVLARKFVQVYEI